MCSVRKGAFSAFPINIYWAWTTPAAIHIYRKANIATHLYGTSHFCLATSQVWSCHIGTWCKYKLIDLVWWWLMALRWELIWKELESMFASHKHELFQTHLQKGELFLMWTLHSARVLFRLIIWEHIHFRICLVFMKWALCPIITLEQDWSNLP